jgi:molybdate transport system substrate-binding protein
MPIVLKVLSAGAVKPGLSRVADAFGAETDFTVKISFATAPSILARLRGDTASSETADIVIAPPSVLDDLVSGEKYSVAERTLVGRIGVGVMVRENAPPPAISTVDEFKQSVLDAESLVYNQASTGIYLEGLFDRLGIGAKLLSKSTRYADFAAVLDHVRKGKGREIGFGAATVIVENTAKGVKFVGALPSEIQNYTSYVAAILPNRTVQTSAREFLRYLESPHARSLLAAAGIA